MGGTVVRKLPKMIHTASDFTLTISLNWAGIVEGPHPVGLSDITGGSNLAAILDLFTLKTYNMIF